MKINIARHAIIAIGLFGVGAASQVLFDIYILNILTDSEIAEWGVIKAMMISICPLFLVGTDLTLVRFGNLSKKLLRAVVGLILVGSFCASMYLMLNWGIQYYVYIFGLFILFPLNNMVFQALRSKKSFLLAQIFQQHWRVALIVYLTMNLMLPDGNISAESIVSVLFWVLIVSQGIGWALILGKFKHEMFVEEVNIKDQKKSSLIFLLITATMAIAAYADQLLLATNLTAKLFAIYMAHISIFLLPFVTMANISGFFLGPILAHRSRDKENLHINKILWLFFIVGILLFLSLFGLGLFIFDIIFSSRFELQFNLALSITGIGFLRFLYTVPSAALGMASSIQHMSIYYKLLVAGSAAHLSLFFIGLNFLDDIILVSLIATYVNWIIRTNGCILLMKRIWN